MSIRNEFDLREHWTLDPGIVFLNHGSFGACPHPVLEAQREIRDRLEHEPVRFFLRDYPALLEEARSALAAFVGAPPEDLVFVPNATTGVNAVLHSVDLVPGDEVLVTDQAYPACRNALDAEAARRGFAVVVCELPFPVASEEDLVAPVVGRVTERTRLALIDHIPSQTGLVLPIARLVQLLAERGVDTLVDGAHAPGMIPLAIEALGAAYYAGNCHKWLCAPKGAGFLVVRRDRQARIRPTTISLGATMPVLARSRFQLEFDWTGTDDPSAYLAVAAAIEFLGALFPGGWEELMARNRALAIEARRILCRETEIAPPCPEEMLGALASIPIPALDWDPSDQRPSIDPLQDRLFFEHAIEVPILYWPAFPRRILRVSAQVYNQREQYEVLAHALGATLA